MGHYDRAADLLRRCPGWPSHQDLKSRVASTLDDSNCDSNGGTLWRTRAIVGKPSAPHFKTISGAATLTGVGFFDFLHGQTGVAPNGIELHPVLSFTLAARAAEPPPPATSSPAPALVVDYPCETSDCNCSDFPTHAEAQRIFEKHGGSPSNNWSGLDRDHDGLAYESLP